MNKRFQIFCKHHPVEIRGDKAILYKAVYKEEHGYFSYFDNNFYYKVGEAIKIYCDGNIARDCSRGLHAGSLSLAVRFAVDYLEDCQRLTRYAILECEVPIDKIVVPFGLRKVRTSELTVLREVPVEEYKHLLQ